MDISPGNYLQIEMTELSGVNLTIDEIRLDPGPGPDGGDGTMLGSLTIAGNDPDGDKSLIDGTGNFNFHNTKLKVFGRR